MTLPTRWNPLRQITRFDPIADFDNIFSGFGLRPISREFHNMLDMRMDVTENDKAFCIKVDVPVVRKEDIDVVVEGNQVTISAEVNREKAQENEKELHSERYSGKAFRSFSLPFEVDSAKADAHYDGGVLTLTLPKTASTVSKRLSIN